MSAWSGQECGMSAGSALNCIVRLEGGGGIEWWLKDERWKIKQNEKKYTGAADQPVLSHQRQKAGRGKKMERERRITYSTEM